MVGVAVENCRQMREKDVYVFARVHRQEEEFLFGCHDVVIEVVRLVRVQNVHVV